MTALYALRTALVVTQEVFVARQIADLMVDIKSKMVDQLLRADYQYFTKRGVGYFNNAATVEFTNLTNAFDYCTRAMVAAGFTVYLRRTGAGRQSGPGRRLHRLRSTCVLPA